MRERFDTLPTPEPLEPNVFALPAIDPDMSLALRAGKRWQESRDAVFELERGAPGAGDLPQRTGATAGQGMLAAWEQYWASRAPGTPLSRRAAVAGHYKTHFEAACQMARAYAAIDADTCFALLDCLAPRPPAQPVVSEVALRHSDARAQQAPGVLLLDNFAGSPGKTLVYLPDTYPALQVFATREAAETCLLTKLATPVEPHTARIERAASSLAAASERFATRLQARLETLLDPLDEKALQQLESKRRTQPCFAAPPELVLPEHTDPASALSAFGSLALDMPLITRWASLQQQQQAFSQALGDTGNPLLMARLDTAQAALGQAQDNASSAIAQLLGAGTHEALYALRYPGSAYTQLLQARRDGLQQEGELQHALQQLDDSDWALLRHALGLPASEHAASTDSVVLSLTLSGWVPESAEPRTVELPGALLISHAAPPGQAPASSAVLLYLAGQGGGLQRFASRQALERDWLQTGGEDQPLSVSYAQITGDAIDYSLQSQLYACEQLARDTPASHHGTALAELVEATRACLAVPDHAARNTAFAQVLEQQQSQRLAKALPTWLATLAPEKRQALEALGLRSIEAMGKAQRLLERDLPSREDFARRAVNAHLRTVLAVDGHVEVKLDLPESVTFVRDLVTGSGAPGTPFKEVPKPSKARVMLTLADLALENIDDAMKQRLDFMIVTVSGDAQQPLATLQRAIDKAWLIDMVQVLDLGGQYETCIREAFQSAPAHSRFEHEYRRECLIAPYRTTLKLHAALATHQQHLDAAASKILDIAIDADSRIRYSADGHAIELRPAGLTTGGSDTLCQGTSLFAITFIHDRRSGQTVLYLPDAPDGRFFRAFASLEEARVKLFQLTLDSDMRSYIARSTLAGDPIAHERRLSQAHLRHFDGIVEVGQPWPVTTSLACLQLDMKMGRLIEAHRATSRSNDALWLETFALNSAMVFQYLKWALGVVPFVGSALALYDAWDSANQAVAALLRGDLGNGLALLESVFMSLIDVLIDAAPGAHGLAGMRTRQRQMRSPHASPAKLPALGLRQARQRAQRFAGYEFDQPLDLVAVQPVGHGHYRGVYRLAEGDFITRDNRAYAVEWDPGLRTWRLKGSKLRTYKQPIDLDESGQWDTHGALHGMLINGGLAGGGAVLTRVADGLDPFWPQAIRERLPRWWTDRFLRRQQALQERAHSMFRTLDEQTKDTNRLLSSAFPGEPGARTRMQLLAALDKDLQMAKELNLKVDELLPMISGNRRRYYLELSSRLAWIVTDRTGHCCNVLRFEVLEQLDQIEALHVQVNATPVQQMPQRLRLLEQGKALRVKLLRRVRKYRELIEQMNIWNARITVKDQRAKVRKNVQSLNETFTPNHLASMEAGNLLQMIHRYDITPDTTWLTLQVRMKEQLLQADQMIASQLDLPDLIAPLAQRNRMRQQCIDIYGRLRVQLTAWAAGYPDFFEMRYVDPLLDALEQLAERAEKQLSRTAQQAPGNSSGQRSRKKIFETVNNHLWVGEEQPARGTVPRQFTVTGAKGIAQTYVQAEGGKWRRVDSVQGPPAVIDLPHQVAEAVRRLQGVDGFCTKVVAHYSRRDMHPADLEDMLVLEAGELQFRAARLENLAPTHPLIEQLRARATGLVEQGRRLRIEHSLRFTRPNEGMLDYLVQQRAVTIARISDALEMPRRPHEAPDFLVEYEVRDLIGVAPGKLWYVHFHYGSANAAFQRFSAAHIKIAAQRNLGLQWQVAQGSEAIPIWRGKLGMIMARKHFEALST